MRILYLSAWFPYPPDNGIKIRTLSLIKALARRHEVDVAALSAQPPNEEQLAALRPYCRNILTEARRPYRPGGLEALLGFFSPLPRSVASTYSPAMAAAVRHAASHFTPDLVICGEISMAPYALALRRLPRILEALELSLIYETTHRPARILQRWRGRLTWIKHAAYVRRYLSHFDACTVASPTELRRVRELAPGPSRLAAVPNGTDLERNTFGSDQPEPDMLIYSGALTYEANFDAVNFFLSEVFPLILAQRPATRLQITGGLAGVPVERLPQSPAVTFTGYLDDVRPAIQHSSVAVVPLRSGGGTRLKILESLALGTPVVATPKGAEGLDLTPGRDLLIAETPADFAAAVLGLLGNPGLREAMRQSGRQAVEARYDFAKIGEAFCDFVEDVAAKSGRIKGRVGEKIETA